MRSIPQLVALRRRAFLRIRVWLCLSVVAALLVGCLSADAFASVGAGVGASPLELATPADPGTSDQLVPLLLVVNTGTSPAQYHLRVTQLSREGQQRTLPAVWIQFGANDFQLAPKAKTWIRVSVSVPTSATAGSYSTDVIATGVAPHSEGRVAAGAAAATAILIKVRGTSSSSFPWRITLILGVIVLLAAIVVVTQSGIRLRFERRRPMHRRRRN